MQYATFLCALADHLYNVTMYEDVCIPVSVCWTRHQSKVILSGTQKHLTWSELAKRDNVNRTYNTNTQQIHFCFRNVTDSFICLEYCEVRKNPPCNSEFCCNNWAEFVSRTCVNVDGGRGKLFSLHTPCCSIIHACTW